MGISTRSSILTAMLRFTCIMLFLVPVSLRAADYFVAPNGNDAWSGKLAAPNADKSDGPFATLEHARDTLRKDKGTLFLRGGTYQLPKGIKLDAADSNTTWRAYEKETPILVGGRQITRFTPYKGAILQADLAAQDFKGATFRQLMFNGQRQHLARFPNNDPSNPYGGGWAYVDGKIVNMYAEVLGEDRHTLLYKAADVREWARPTEGEVFIFPRYNWWNNIIFIKSIDRDARKLTLVKDASYAIRPGDRYYVQGLFEELDAPGEWYLDRQANILYFWPPAGATGDIAVTVPTAPSILHVENASNVTIRGLTFECSNDNGISIKNCEKALVAGCTIRNVCSYVGSGVSVSSGRDNGVVGCDISHTGSSGISIWGGDRKTLTPANLYAENNYIHHVGVYYKQGVGISMGGVGNRASRNLIHDGPRMGIMFSGNNLLIEYNEVRHVNLETEDTGAVYTGGRDWISSRGTVIRHNYFHDMLGFGRDSKGNWVSPHFAWGVYLDDNTGGVDVIGNIIARCPRAGIHLHNGRDNLMENNIILDCGLMQVEYSGWTKDSRMWKDHFPTMVKGYDMIDKQAWKNMRNIGTTPDQAILPDGKIMSGNTFRNNIVSYTGEKSKLFNLRNVNLQHNAFDNNIYFHPQGPLTITGVKKDALDFAAWQETGQDRNSIVTDPMLAPDFRLKEGSPATKFGFHPIPVEKIGPYQHELRATWPIVQAEGAREKPAKMP